MSDYKGLFRNLYGYINDGTLRKAASENPDLLIRLLEEETLSIPALDAALDAMADTRNPIFLPQLRHLLGHPNPGIRNCAREALEVVKEDN